jgi:hypothetical protein
MIVAERFIVCRRSRNQMSPRNYASQFDDQLAKMKGGVVAASYW